MIKNRYVNSLVTFVKEHKNDFIDILLKSPYNLKNVKNCTWHPDWYIFIYNLMKSDFKNEIVRACRGIILSINDKEIKPVSVPYTKFFNYGQEEGKDIDELINWNKSKISLKIDGMLLKTACIEENGEKRLYFFTNGMFNLNIPFADFNIYDEIETRDMKFCGDLLTYALKKVDNTVKINFNVEIGSFYLTGGWTDKIPLGSTLMFELISPRNKIICEYKETKLFLHGYRDPDLIEHDPREMDFGLKFEFPELLDASNYEDLKKIVENFNGKEKEGCVVVDYTNPETPRAKIKCESYLKLKFYNDKSSSNQSLFKAVVANEYDDLATYVPSIVSKIEEIKEKINIFTQWFISESKKVSEICKGNNIDENRKKWVMHCKSKVSKQLFPIYMDMANPNNLIKLEKKLENFAAKRNGYENFRKIMEEISHSKQ